jgi:hypothetical protein
MAHIIYYSIAGEVIGDRTPMCTHLSSEKQIKQIKAQKRKNKKILHQRWTFKSLLFSNKLHYIFGIYFL